MIRKLSCGNCRHWAGGECKHPEIMLWSESKQWQPAPARGYYWAIITDSRFCCTLHEQKEESIFTEAGLRELYPNLPANLKALPKTFPPEL